MSIDIRPFSIAIAAISLLIPSGSVIAQPGRTCSEAVKLREGAVVGGSLLPSEESRYWYELPATAGHLYRLRFQAHQTPDVLPFPPTLTIHAPGCAAPIEYVNPGGSFTQTVVRFPSDQQVLIECGRNFSPAFPISFGVTYSDLGYVPDDAPNRQAEAGPSVDLREIAGRIDYAGDVDVYRVRLEARTVYKFRFEYQVERAPGAAIDFDWEMGFEAGFSRDPVWPSAGPLFLDTWQGAHAVNETRFVVQADQGGEYFLYFGRPWFKVVGQYSLALLEAAPLPPRPSPGEPGSICETPLPLPGGVTVDPMLDGPDDQRWYVVSLEGGHAYSLTHGELRAPGCGITLARTDPWYGQPATVWVPSSGNYEVLASGEVGFGPLRITDIGPSTDEAPGLPELAPLMTLDNPSLSGRTDFPGDVDCYRLQLAPGGLYRATLSGQGGLDGLTAVFESPGSPVAQSAWIPYTEYGVPPSPGKALVYADPSGQGVVRVRVSSSQSSGYPPNPYTINLVRIDDPSLPVSAPCDQPVFITPGQSVVNASDPDAGPMHFAFHAAAGRRYRLTSLMQFPPGGLRVPLQVLDPDCGSTLTQFLFWSSDNLAAEFVARESGPLRVLIDLPIPVPYELVLEDLGPDSDAIGDTPDTAEPIDAADVTIESSIDFPRDVDIFRVRVVPGATYEFTLQSLSSTAACYAFMSDSGGLGFEYFVDLQADPNGPAASSRFTVSRQLLGPVYLTISGQEVEAPVEPRAPYRFTLRRIDCPADMNADGLVDADDLGDFITAFFSVPPDPRTDFNADGVINTDDLGDFITAYFSGC